MISKAADIQEMRDSFYEIFRSRNPFGPAGNSLMTRRVVLYPTYGYHLEENQFQALVDASSECGEKSFFISEVEHEPDPFATDHHWVCTSPTYAEYSNLPLSVENAIYSSSRKWGILISHEDHGLLASKDSFWEAFQKRYPHWKDDHKKFVEVWRQNEMNLGTDVSWLKDFLDHLSEI
jgi:hypothetical protein